MAGKELKGREKVVSKMTRDGLTEENLADGSVKDISHKRNRTLFLTGKRRKPRCRMDKERNGICKKSRSENLLCEKKQYLRNII